MTGRSAGGKRFAHRRINICAVTARITDVGGDQRSGPPAELGPHGGQRTRAARPRAAAGLRRLRDARRRARLPAPGDDFAYAALCYVGDTAEVW
jgi:hypothetical protein